MLIKPHHNMNEIKTSLGSPLQLIYFDVTLYTCMEKHKMANLILYMENIVT